jgi:hypothetical protein
VANSPSSLGNQPLSSCFIRLPFKEQASKYGRDAEKQDVADLMELPRHAQTRLGDPCSLRLNDRAVVQCTASAGPGNQVLELRVSARQCKFLPMKDPVGYHAVPRAAGMTSGGPIPCVGEP